MRARVTWRESLNSYWRGMNKNENVYPLGIEYKKYFEKSQELKLSFVDTNGKSIKKQFCYDGKRYR